MATCLLQQMFQPVAIFALSIFTVNIHPSISQAQSLTQLETTPLTSEDVDAGFPPSVQPEFWYRLGAGDSLRLNILGVPDFSGRYNVLPDGSINLPLVGRVFVQGLTLAEATDAIADKFKTVLKVPTIVLNLISARPIKVGITGEVHRPGTYTIPLTPGVGSNPSTQYPTVTQALNLAQGITQTADLRRIQIRRLQKAGEVQVINLDLWAFIQGGDLTQDLILYDGDTIVVPTATNLSLTEGRELALTTFSPKTDTPRNIIVVGEVHRPGAYVVVGGNTNNDSTLGFPTVTRAIQLAGGIKPTADIRQIYIRRLTRAGKEQIININIEKLLQGGDFSQDAIVQDGDSIIVPTATEVTPAEKIELATANFSPETIKVYVVGEVRSPRAELEVPPNTTLNQGLLAAGKLGYENIRGQRGSVKLIRLDPNGSVSERTIPVDLTQDMNEETNPLLLNNDIIVVDRNLLTQVSDDMELLVKPVRQFTDVLEFVLTLDRLLDIFQPEND